MKQVSAQYAASMASLLRNRSSVRVRFENVNPYAAKDGTWISNGEMPCSDVLTLDVAHEYGKPYATLEENRWMLDGEYRIYPSSLSASDGYISKQISNEQGFFEENPVITREFSQERPLIGLTLTFDKRAQEWPLEFALRMYDGAGNSIFSQTAQPKSAEVYIETETLNVKKIEIEFLSMLPYRRARLESVLYGIARVFTNDEIQETEQSHDVDPISRRLPQESFAFTIIDYEHEYDPENPRGAYEFIDRNAPVSIQYGYELPDGTTEWLKADRYKLSGKPSVSRDIAHFSATGLLGSMTGKYYKSTVGSKSLYDMAVSVLEDADLAPTPDGEDPWIIDESLKNILTNAVLPIDTHANCLQLIAHAACMKLYTDDDNVIHIDAGTDTDTDPEFVIDFNSFKDGSPVVSKIPSLRAVVVSKYSYATAGGSSEIYKGTTSEETVHVEFSGLAENVYISVSGGTVVSREIYGRAADLILSGSGNKTITITGTQLQEGSIDKTVTFGADGEIAEVKNPLITNDQMAEAVAQHVGSYLMNRSTYDAEYRGNPEMEVGDVIAMQTRYSDAVKGLVLCDAIKFNGAISGTLKVKVIGGEQNA